MSKVINLTLHRRMRRLQRAANYLGSGRFLSKGRTQGKSMSVEDIIALSEEHSKHPPIPIGSGRKTLRQAIDEAPGIAWTPHDGWVIVGGRAEDAIKQLPTATIIPFPGGRV